MKKVISVIGDVFVAILLIVAVSLTILVITSTRSDDRIPNLFGYALMNVETNSMESENGFFVGDLIIVRKLDDEEANNLKVGDVITFRRYFERTMYLETHRIVENTPGINNEYHVYESEIKDGVWDRNGVKYYVTKGDNTPTVDFDADTGALEYTDYNRIVGIWEGTRIPKLGAVLKFMRSQMGFMICVVLPVALFFIYELYVFIMTLTRKQKEKSLQEVADKEAELKAAAVAEFLAQQQANGGETTPPAEDTAPVGDGSPVPQNAQDAPAEPAEKPAEEKPAEESPADISEAEKQRIIQEYLAKQKKEEE